MTRISEITLQKNTVSSTDLFLIEDGADNNVTKRTTGAAIIAAAPVQSVAGRTGNVTISKSDVGLGSVVNSDTTNASNITSGTLAAGRLPSVNIGTTSVDLTRASGSLSLTGVSIDGNAGTVTNGVYTTGSYSDPSWLTISKSKVGLANVENTALSTWAGSTNITTLGTISTGTVPAANVSGLAASATTNALNASNISSGTLNAARLPSVNIGTTSVDLTRASGNLSLTGIPSLQMPGATSGGVTLQPAAVAGTTTITLPATTGTVVTTGDSGTVTSTMIANGTIVNEDINSAAAIAGSKISPDFGSQTVTTTGIFSAAAGTAAAPSIAITGDTNTGIYSPGADQIALATGGVGRVSIDSTGNIALGANASGDRSIRINSVGNAYLEFSTSGSTGLHKITAGNSSTSTGGLIFETTPSGGTEAERVRIDSSGTVNIVGVGTPGSTQAISFNGSAPINSLVVNSSGNVGIGTSNPAHKLQVFGTSDAVADFTGSGVAGLQRLLQLRTDTSNSYGFQIKGDYSTEGYLIQNYYNSYLALGTYNLERLRIDSSGNVGIGTSSPESRLDVRGAITAGVNTDSSNGNDVLLQSNHTDGNLGVISSIYSSGALGIGYGVKGGGSAGTFLSTTGSSMRHLLYTQNSVDGHVWYGQTSASAVAINSSVALEERMRIDSSGRLLVGTSSARTVSAYGIPAIQNESTSHETSSLALISNSNTTASPALVIAKTRGTSNGSFTVVSSGDALGVIQFQGADGTQLLSGARITAEVDGTPGTNDMPGRLVFSTTADGANAPTERMRITNDGVSCYNKAAPAAVNTTATLTIANLKTGIITSTTAAAVTMTLPTGTDAEAGFSGIYTNMSFEWYVINTGATNAVTVAANTGHTIVGSGTVAASTSGHFMSRRTASNTFVTYRLS